MKGFDRPLKPDWIYKIIQEVEVGERIYQRREKLYNILVELDGKTGKRKVITVIGRYYLKSFDNSKGKKVKSNIVYNMIKNKPYEETIPVMFFNLLVKAPILQHFSEQLLKYYHRNEDINSDYLRKKSYEKIGERDIAARSLRNFLSTLVDFRILRRNENKSYSWNKKIKVNEENAINFLRLFSEYYLNSPQIPLNDLPESLFFYFDMPDLQEIANKYNNDKWQFTRRVNTSLITFI